MQITREQNGTALTLALEGRLDTATSPELDQEIQRSLPGLTELVLDMSALEYISSAGLRVLLAAEKRMAGKMRLRGVNETIMEVFEVTGFVDILSIE